MHICERKLDLEPKGQGQQKTEDNKQGNRNIPPLNKLSITGVQLMSQTGYKWPTYEEECKQRLRMIRLIITTIGRFLESRTKFNL